MMYNPSMIKLMYKKTIIVLLITIISIPIMVNSVFGETITLGELREEIGMITNLHSKIKKDPLFTISEFVGSLDEKKFPFRNVDGYMEITVLDRQNKLVGFIQTDHLEIYQHEKVLNQIENWKIVDVVKKDGRYYKVLKSPQIIDKEKTDYKLQGGTGAMVRLIGEIDALTYYAHHNMYPIVQGETFIQQYVIYQPID